MIAKYKLHLGDCWEPIYILALFEVFAFGYQQLGRRLEAQTLRWRDHHRHYIGFLVHSELKRVSKSARRRYVLAHELAHALCKHEGAYFYLWKADGKHTSGCQHDDSPEERQCDLVAAYLLIRLDALLQLAEEGDEFTARVLDIPEFLVPLRWEIYKQLGR